MGKTSGFLENPRGWKSPARPALKKERKRISLILENKDTASPYCIEKINRNDYDTFNKLDEMGIFLGEHKLFDGCSGGECGQCSVCCILNLELSTFSQAKS